MYEELYPEPLEIEEKEEWKKQRVIKTSGKNVTKLADEYIANFDRNKINNLIEQSIADEMFVPGELHKRLLKLHWSDIFTTNYDTLLEQTVDMIYRENNYEIIYSQNDLPGSIKPRIIKLHGSIPQVKPYIISDEDYRTYPDKYSALVNTVQQAMLETRLCLLGFSGDDPNEKDLYLERPYPKTDRFWKPKEEEKEEYFEKMKEYSCKVEMLISPYILLPEDKRNKYAKYFSEQFGIVLKLIQDEVPGKLISSIVKIFPILMHNII